MTTWKWVKFEDAPPSSYLGGGGVAAAVSDSCPESSASTAINIGVFTVRWAASRMVQHPLDAGKWSAGCWEILVFGEGWKAMPAEWRPFWVLAPSDTTGNRP